MEEGFDVAESAAFISEQASDVSIEHSNVRKVAAMLEEEKSFFRPEDWIKHSLNPSVR